MTIKDKKLALLSTALVLAQATFGWVLVANRTPVGVAELFTKNGKAALAATLGKELKQHCGQRVPLTLLKDGYNNKERAWKIDMGYDQNETLMVGGKEIGKVPQSIYWVLPSDRTRDTSEPLMTQKEAVKRFVSIHEQLTESAKKAITADWYPDAKIVTKDTSTGFIVDIAPIGRSKTFPEAVNGIDGQLRVARALHTFPSAGAR